MKQIPITDIAGFQIGYADNQAQGTDAPRFCAKPVQ